MNTYYLFIFRVIIHTRSKIMRLIMINNKQLKNIIIISVIAITGLFLFSCATLENIFKEPKVSFDKAEISDISFQDITLDFSFNVDNPNSVGVEMAGYAYDLEIEGNSLIKGETKEPLRIEPDDRSVIKLPVTLTYKDLYSMYGDIKGKDQIAYKIKNVFTFDLPVFGKASFPVEHEGSFPAVKLPEIAIDSLNLKSLNPFKSELELVLRIRNRNNFSLSLDSIDYDFKVNTVTWGKGMSRTSTDFKENGENRITLPISVNPAEVGLELIKSAISGRKLNMNFDGKAVFRTGYPGFDKAEVKFNTSDRRGIDS